MKAKKAGVFEEAAGQSGVLQGKRTITIGLRRVTFRTFIPALSAHLRSASIFLCLIEHLRCPSSETSVQ